MNGTLRALTTIFLLSPVAVAQQYVISTYAGGALPQTQAADGSIGAPVGVATNAAGDVYFVSSSLNSVFRLTSGGMLTRIAGTSRRGYSGDGGPATSAQLQLGVLIALARPANLAVDSTGNVFIADTGNDRIRRISPSGIITTVAGNGIRGFSGDGGPATSAQLTFPTGVAVDTSGNLFIVDLNLRVRKVATSGIITTVAGNGTCCFSGDGGPAISAQVASVSIAVDRGGNLFIADSIRIRMVSPSGIITTVPGSESLSGGVAVDGAGNLLVASGGAIRKDLAGWDRHHTSGQSRSGWLLRRWGPCHQRTIVGRFQRGRGQRRQPVHRGFE